MTISKPCVCGEGPDVFYAGRWWCINCVEELRLKHPPSTPLRIVECTRCQGLSFANGETSCPGCGGYVRTMRELTPA